MFKKHVSKHLSAYCHGELSPERSRSVAEHLLSCERCRREYDQIKLGVSLAKRLAPVPAPDSMWDGITVLLRGRSVDAARRPEHSWFGLAHIMAGGWPRFVAASAVLILIIGIATTWYYTRQPRVALEVEGLEGAPIVGSAPISKSGRLAVGEWLVTDSDSRARINVSSIGRVEIDPNTRVRLVETRATEHRLALAAGRLHAQIWAPPRLFFVETPSAVAVDLGCAYTLEVDNFGRSYLHVTSGWVMLELRGRESIVPAGALCETRPGIGPGTPFFEDAPEGFRKALAKIDFETGGQEATAEVLNVILAGARKRDTLTLWHLLSRVNGADRARLYDRMAELVPPPEGVNKDGVMRLDQLMLDLWKEKLEPAWFDTEDPSWRKAWRKGWED